MRYGKVQNVVMPKEFQKYFWDVNFDELTLEKYPKFISERILNFGDLESLRWFFSWSNKDFVRSLLQDNRNLNPKTRNFLEIILNELPE